MLFLSLCSHLTNLQSKTAHFLACCKSLPSRASYQLQEIFYINLHNRVQQATLSTILRVARSIGPSAETLGVRHMAVFLMSVNDEMPAHTCGQTLTPYVRNSSGLLKSNSDPLGMATQGTSLLRNRWWAAWELTATLPSPLDLQGSCSSTLGPESTQDPDRVEAEQAQEGGLQSHIVTVLHIRLEVLISVFPSLFSILKVLETEFSLKANLSCAPGNSAMEVPEEYSVRTSRVCFTCHV